MQLYKFSPPNTTICIFHFQLFKNFSVCTCRPVHVCRYLKNEFTIVLFVKWRGNCFVFGKWYQIRANRQYINWEYANVYAAITLPYTGTQNRFVTGVGDDQSWICFSCTIWQILTNAFLRKATRSRIKGFFSRCGRLTSEYL